MTGISTAIDITLATTTTGCTGMILSSGTHLGVRLVTGTCGTTPGTIDGMQGGVAGMAPDGVGTTLGGEVGTPDGGAAGMVPDGVGMIPGSTAGMVVGTATGLVL